MSFAVKLSIINDYNKRNACGPCPDSISRAMTTFEGWSRIWLSMNSTCAVEKREIS